MDRREFLKTLAAGSAALAAAPLLGSRALATPAVGASADEGVPNILVVIVDQLRPPMWFPDQQTLDGYLPNIARLRKASVSFNKHYTVAAMCTPSRASMLTGLYAHQHFLLNTGAYEGLPYLDPRFPTWGTALRGFGYKTWWYGKWHVSDGAANPCDLEPYGFSGGTCPSPNGAAGEGLEEDDDIANQFLAWFQENGAGAPWCTTVSFVNPHDIVFYPRQTDRIDGENNPPKVFTALPPNFETPLQLRQRKKPGLQLGMIQASNRMFGNLDYSGAGYEAQWTKMLDLYLQCQRYVDEQLGRVLDALDASPDVAKKTIVVFTADHGEHAGSHGMRGKGGGAYEESMGIPLMVKDPTGRFANAPGTRDQFTCSADLMPLLMTLGLGDNSWRDRPEFQHLAGRLDIAKILSDNNAAGRPYVLHTVDENHIEAARGTVSEAPIHVIAYRSAAGKLAVNSHWKPGTVDLDPAGQESECYDYATDAGRKETANVAPNKPALYTQLYNAMMTDAFANELRKPLPAALQPAQADAKQRYLNYVAGT
ncbi:MAG: sulfatase-like hydrolase/transferase [Planctomycetota bacterium]|nr:sulfatase-like hydrolase/transferase [Planctomycetota bacterium]